MGRPFIPRPLCPICGNTCKRLDRIFCSNQCLGESRKGQPKPIHNGNKYNFKGDNVSVWANYKRMQFLCPPGPCSHCGSQDNTLIHHKDHNPFNTRPDNLFRLCRACHMIEHYEEIKFGYNLNNLKKRV